MQEKFAPTVKPHAFGCKRISLENGLYERFNKPNVHLVDINETPIVEITPRGIKTSQKEWDFDYIVCATGFDAITGGILQMNVVGKDGLDLRDKWQDGVKTYMGLCVAGFPNMWVAYHTQRLVVLLTSNRFFTYGPQAPTALCNGPSCAELQGDWIVNLMEYMRENKLRCVNATTESEKTWAKGIWEIANMSLLPSTRSVGTTSARSTTYIGTDVQM